MSRPKTRDTITSLPFIARTQEWFRTKREARHSLRLADWSEAKFYLLLQHEMMEREDIIRFETALINWAKAKRQREGANDLLDRQIYELECSRELLPGQAI
jgi:hypothetical protein